MTGRHPLHCIIPPYMFESIVEHGSPEQREAAQSSMEVSEAIREGRAGGLESAGGTVAAAGKERIVFTANNTSGLPGTPVRNEGDGPTGDAAVDEAYDGSGLTFDLFKEVFGRNSIDDNNMRLDSTVHYQVGYDNAFWNGAQMVYGDGDEDLPVDQRLFNRFTKSLDVIGHELTHGVTEFTAGLVYRNQSGALNEHYSDVFGSLVRQRALNQAATAADWIIGADLFTANVNGVGIRSMKAPGTAYDDPVLGKDRQPDHMDNYDNTTSDNGGVHINSGIPNRAFYLVATELGGNAWADAGDIWYRSLTDARLTSLASFQEAADLTWAIAAEVYGEGGAQHTAVAGGWAGVGITVSGDTTPPDPTPDPTNAGCMPFGSVLVRLGLLSSSA